MITLKEFIELIDYRITEGNDYGWNCFGRTAYCLTSWNGEHDGHSLSVVFDTEYQTVYQVEVFDYKNDRAYRMLHPDCVEDYYDEAKERDVDPDEAYDNVKFVNLETVDDFIEKARAIINGEEYDTRVDVPLTLSKEDMFELMQIAHERDITLNQLVEEVLRDAIEKQSLEVDIRRGPVIQSPPFPPDNFTVEEARAAVKAAKKKKGKRG